MRIVCLVAIVLFAAAPRAGAETPLERGAYLMRGIVACGNCHTPKTPEGELVADMEMAGSIVVVEEMFTAYAPNITPDVETGIGAWSDDEIIAAIRDGRRPDGSIIGPPMPIGVYRGISDGDVAAIVAYLRELPARSNRVPKSAYRIPLPPSYGPPVTSVPEVPRDDVLAYGAYLAGPLGHCFECHSPLVGGKPDWQNQPGAGGLSIPGPWGLAVTANITPHPEDGIAGYSDDDIKAAITRGTRPDGSRLSPPMPFGFYATMSGPDLDALVAYLRTLKPLPSPD